MRIKLCGGPAHGNVIHIPEDLIQKQSGKIFVSHPENNDNFLMYRVRITTKYLAVHIEGSVIFDFVKQYSLQH